MSGRPAPFSLLKRLIERFAPDDTQQRPNSFGGPAHTALFDMSCLVCINDERKMCLFGLWLVQTRGMIMKTKAQRRLSVAAITAIAFCAAGSARADVVWSEDWNPSILRSAGR